MDHDTQPKKKLVPYGILTVTAGLLSIFIGTSNETSDFIVDCLEQWWEANKTAHPTARQLLINLDNGPENSGARTQFLYRLVKFADATGLEVKLVYYPAVPQQVQPHRTLLGHPGKPLERDLAQQRAHRGGVGSDDDLERDSAGRQADREDLRHRSSNRQGRLPSRREPTPTRPDPPQV